MTRLDELARDYAKTCDGTPWDLMSLEWHDHYRGVVRTVLGLVRLPTETMVKAAFEIQPYFSGLAPADKEFTAMIDAILSEGE